MANLQVNDSTVKIVINNVTI